MKRVSLLLVLAGVSLWSCKSNNPDQQAETEKTNTLTPVQQQAQAYLDAYNQKYQEMYTRSSEAAWRVNTHIVEGDTMNAWNSTQADEAMAAFTGSAANIDSARKYLDMKDQLLPLQLKQFQAILYSAANNPQTLEGVVKKRIKAETAQTEKLYGFTFTMNGKKVTPNDIDSILTNSKDLKLRLAAWRASKEVGKALKPGLVNLRGLRNQVVRGLGYPDFFNYQVSDYGMTTEEMMKLNEQFIRELWPLYRELHTYARYELAKRYGVKEVPDMIPAHWLPNRWGQDWSAMVDVKGLNLDSVLAKKSPEWIVKQAEAFYESLGFSAVPQSFWDKSSLYPVPKDSSYTKNTHASAWHMDLNNDVRSLMSVTSNAEWYETVNHELGHIHYYLTYNNKDVPPLLRQGANRAYHEAFGTMIGLAAMQKPFLEHLGLMPANTHVDSMQVLLKQALNFIVFTPFSAGTMTHFEKDLYADSLPADQFNKDWWTLVQQYQGIAPPEPRGEQYCDAATKTHINDDPAQYYDYAIANVLLFQMHVHIARDILHQDPHNANYYGSKAVGDFLQSIMYPGASKDWREVLREKTGSDLSAKYMLDYFAPLMEYLKKENQGRKYTLPETL